MRVLLFIAALGTFVAAGLYRSRLTPYERATSQERSHFKHVIVPLEPGTRFTLSSGAFGCCTHNLPGLEYAWDFDVPYGTPVIAVEDGKVIQVWEPDGGGGCDRKFNDVAHNIKVLHSDGTVAQYVHVGSKVRTGDFVRKGQIIAVTANNGFHCVPQLHFNVFRNREHIPENGAAETIPLLFDGLPGGGIAREGYSGTVTGDGPR